METYQMIGQRLKEARERAGLTQEQVAEALGIKREQISYFENGHREIDVLTLSKLADVYGYPVEHFLKTEQVEKPSDLSVAFRAAELSEDDLRALAWVQRFTRNLSELTKLLGKGKES